MSDPGPSTALLRDSILERMRTDLIGPSETDEVLEDTPSNRYLTAILYPQSTAFAPEEDEAIPLSNGHGAETGEAAEPPPAVAGTFKPSTCGFSFGVEPESADAELTLVVHYATYDREVPEPAGDDTAARPRPRWRRRPKAVENVAVPVRPGYKETVLHTGLRLVRRVVDRNGIRLVTLQFVNDYHQNPLGESALFVDGFEDRESATFFQFSAEVWCGKACSFAPRPKLRTGRDRDERIADLIYRDSADFAVGHTASATWRPAEEPDVISLTWTPSAVVRKMNPAGDPGIASALSRTSLGRLAPVDLAACSAAELQEATRALCDAYELWIAEREAEASKLSVDLRETAGLNLDDCRKALVRMRAGADLLISDGVVRQAFQAANRAMLVQAAWTGWDDDEGFPNAHIDLPTAADFNYAWRPFQMGFALMCLASCASRSAPDRDVFDLIWFPTGGGKTEAYLLLAAFTLFHRRLVHGEAGGGVSVMMRYTLRTLTVQQFQRAAALITACDVIRREDEGATFGTEPYSIGLWVGNGTTPNRREDAQTALDSGVAGSTPAQLRTCPCCGDRTTWRIAETTGHYQPHCDSADCGLGSGATALPVLSVDEDIYDRAPSLVIGTVDKFAQIVRKAQTGSLFGLGKGFIPPDLIVQDELHLIGGPLGSLTGLYETAIDRLCATEDGPVKIIGSTATIRRAADQILHLFDRRAAQFPPPGLSWRNNFFAELDAGDDGRLYVGFTTAGRSEKFTLQAAAASLIQSGEAFRDGPRDIDPYFTLVAYFNSLKVLGGALVLMEDDVRATVKAIADRRNETPRHIDTPDELTSRKPSSEIPRILESLETRYDASGWVDVLLATNMLSVGVDIPRLGLMLINGQPKFMSEYIQATSRVGRNGPGLVVTLYNGNKIRDRAHFESFCGWHSALYRSVEPSSVTPFASRARDKALHAPLLALVVHLVEPRTFAIDESRRVEVERLVETIVARIRRIDPDEAEQARAQLHAFVRDWFDAAQSGTLKSHWNDRRLKSSLLVSAETAATHRALGRGEMAAVATPNSMRNVEPSVKYILKEQAVYEPK